MADLPIGRAQLDVIAAWLQARTGVGQQYFQTKLTNKFPGLTKSWLDSVSGVGGVSGDFHFYIETSDISADTPWYGTLDDLHEGQPIWVSAFYPHEFEQSRYYQYAGNVSGVVSGL